MVRPHEPRLVWAQFSVGRLRLSDWKTQPSPLHPADLAALWELATAPMSMRAATLEDAVAQALLSAKRSLREAERVKKEWSQTVAHVESRLEALRSKQLPLFDDQTYHVE